MPSGDIVRLFLLLLGFLSFLCSLAEAGQPRGRFNPVVLDLRFPNSTYTRGAAAISAFRAGYRDLQPSGKSEMLYWFVGRRSGAAFVIAISIRSGKIVKVMPA